MQEVSIKSRRKRGNSLRFPKLTPGAVLSHLVAVAPEVVICIQRK